MFGASEWPVYDQGLDVLERCGRALIDADDLVWYVSAASIAAKVYRDRLMAGLWHHKHPEYGFDKHKGYGTAKHVEAILEHGLVPGLHRRDFVPKTVRGRAIWRT
jgi:ribonuclease HII